MAVSLDELKILIEQQTAEGNRRREEDILWRGRMEGTIQHVTDEVTRLNRRQTEFDARLAETAKKASDAHLSGVDLEGRVIRHLGLQDGEIKKIRDETEKQTPIITELRDNMIRQSAALGLLKYLIPGVAVVVPALWWLFLHLVKP